MCLARPRRNCEFPGGSSCYARGGSSVGQRVVALLQLLVFENRVGRLKFEFDDTQNNNNSSYVEDFRLVFGS